MFNLERAIALAATAHNGQKDKAGQPYILHPLYVMNKMCTIDQKIIAVLHDIVEDTEVTLHYIKAIGAPQRIIDGIDAISKRKGETQKDYIERVKGNTLARAVKPEDIKHNLSIERLMPLNEETALRLSTKYIKALNQLYDIDEQKDGTKESNCRP